MKFPKLLLFTLFCLAGTASMAQNLFDSLHTARYADFLFLSGNFKEASIEYERLLSVFGASDEEKLSLVQSYRLQNTPNVALERMQGIWQQPRKISGNVSREYFTLKLLNQPLYLVAFKSELEDDIFLSRTDKELLNVSASMFSGDVRTAMMLMNQSAIKTHPLFEQYQEIAREHINFKEKSPVLAGTLSVIIPGAGKIYTGSVADGLIAFMIVGSSAFQAYRGFNRKGSASVYGWIYTAIGTSFYLGNIYGSIKDANRINYLNKQKTHSRVEAAFFDMY